VYNIFVLYFYAARIWRKISYKITKFLRKCSISTENQG